MYGVNVKGPFLGIEHALPIMKRLGGGSIINMSSACGLVGHMYTPKAYTTMKGALSLLTKSVAARYGKFNIRCNSINPGTANTAGGECSRIPRERKSDLGKCRSAGWPACRTLPRLRFTLPHRKALLPMESLCRWTAVLPPTDASPLNPICGRSQGGMLPEIHMGERLCRVTLQEADELITASRALYDRKLIHAAGGNTSIRVGDFVWISQTGAELGKLTEDKLVKVDLQGKVLEGEPPFQGTRHASGDVPGRENARAVIHVHPTYADGLFDPARRRNPPMQCRPTPRRSMSGPGVSR